MLLHQMKNNFKAKFITLNFYGVNRLIYNRLYYYAITINFLVELLALVVIQAVILALVQNQIIVFRALAH